MGSETVLEMQSREAAARVSHAAQGDRRTAQRLPRMQKSAADARAARQSQSMARSQRGQAPRSPAPVERNTPRASSRISDGQELRDHPGPARRTSRRAGRPLRDLWYGQASPEMGHRSRSLLLPRPKDMRPMHPRHSVRVVQRRDRPVPGQPGRSAARCSVRRSSPSSGRLARV